MEIEDKVKLTHIPKVLVQDFHEALHEFQNDQLIFVLVDDGDEVERGVSLVDDLVILEIKEIAHFGLPGDDQLIHLPPFKNTSFSKRCFSYWVRLLEYHLVSRERP